ncbi:MAG TPA: BlaI/MecI/CopY family transcriptional regulator [Chloroflexia bacterium]|nr:BlaI/MecI/CopY family transcriptional regulator [Chloroflexia bacterium]
MPANQGALQFKFDPTEDGIAKVLGPLESQIMQIVWRMQNATAADVHREMQLTRRQENRDIAYTTVMTTLSRLYDKNILRRRKIGMSFLYTPTLDRDEFINLVVKDVMDSLVGEYGEPVFRYFVDYIGRNEERRRELTRVLTAPAPVGATS